MGASSLLPRLNRKFNYLKGAEYSRRKKRFLDKVKGENKLIVLGNQKTGSTAIAALIATRSGKTVMLDIKDPMPDASWQIVYKYKVEDFSEFIYKYRKDFKRDILKEPSLTFFTEELSEHFPNANYMFIVRNPFDNIRSILNRLNIPGNLPEINFSDWEELNKYPTWRLALDSAWLGEPKGNYIEGLAYRWRSALSVYNERKSDMFLLKYEYFLADKVGSIDTVCDHFDFNIINDISQLKDRQYQSKGINKADHKEFFGVDNYNKIKRICSKSAIELEYPMP